MPSITTIAWLGGSLARLALGALLLSPGCGGEVRTSSEVAALPLGAGAPRAYTESSLAGQPGAALQLQHVAILTLEARSEQQPGGDTGTAEGMDEVLYYLDRQTTLAVSLDPSTLNLGFIVIKDSRGRQRARVERGDSVDLQLAPGAYTFEIHHANAGDRNAPVQMVFLRPLAGSRSSPALGYAAGGQNPNVTTILAGQSCVACDFSNAVLQSDGSSFIDLDGLDLSQSIFDDVYMVGVSLRGANLTSTRWQAGQGSDLVSAPTLYGVDFSNANLGAAFFAGAAFLGVSFRGANLSNVDFCFQCDLSGISSGCAGKDSATCDFSGTPLVEVGCDFSTDPTTGAATNLSGANLSMVVMSTCINFAGATLSNATLAGNTLVKANFPGALLHQTDLSGAHITDSNFSGATLTAAILQNGTFDGSVFTQATIDGANLTGASATNANLSQASLKGTVLSKAILDGATLFEADLQGARLDSARLVDANLNYTNLRGATLSGAQLGAAQNSAQNAATLVGVYMPDADLSNADLRGVDLSGAHIYGDLQLSKLDGALLDGADLSGAICSGAEFINASLTGATFNNAQLVNCMFSGADLTRAVFDSAYLQGASFAGAASVAGARLDNAAIATAMGSWAYMEQDGSPVPYLYGPTQLGNFASDPSVTCPDAQGGPCTADKLNPVNMGPFPPVPTCVPLPPDYSNCTAPQPPATPPPG